MRTLYSRCLLFVIMLLSMVGAHAIEEGLTCKAVYLGKSQISATSLVVFDGLKNHDLKATGVNLSRPLKLSKETEALKISSVSLRDQPDAPFSKVEVPQGAAEIYLIIFDNHGDKTNPFMIRVLDASPNRLKSGHTLWVNFSNYQIKANLGGAEVTLPQGGEMMAKPKIESAGYYKAEFFFTPFGEEASRALMRKSWWHDPKSRYLGVMMNKEKLTPRVFQFRDRPEPDEKSQ